MDGSGIKFPFEMFLPTSMLALLGTRTLAAAPKPPLATGLCPSATLADNPSLIQTGPGQVGVSSFSCPQTDTSAHGRDVNKASNGLSARTNDVCGVQCTVVSCLGSGTAPVASDCEVIADAIDILGADLGSTYQLTAANGFYKQLVFDTCLTYIGVSAQVDTEACWSDWSAIIKQLLAACPGSPVGACTAFAPGLVDAAFSMEIRAAQSV